MVKLGFVCLIAIVLLGSNQRAMAESDAYIQQADPLVSEKDISISQSDPSVSEPDLPGNESQQLDISKMDLVEALLFSKYVREVKNKINENWEPPGEAVNNGLRASFRVFPKGQISRPILVQSSGNKKLDHLALQAIRVSQPFPPFPREFKEPNLDIIIHFRYVNHGEENQENELSKEEFF